MSKVPTHFRDALSSQRTGVNSLDRSGEIIGDAVTRLSQTFFKGIADLEARQQETVNQSRTVKRMGEFSGELMTQVDTIRQQNFLEPEAALEQSEAAYDELRNQYLNAEGDPELRRRVDLGIDRVLASQRVDDMRWKLGQQRLVAQKNYADALNANAQELVKPEASYQFYLDKAAQWQANRENFYQVYGGVSQGNKILEDGLEAYTRAFVYGRIKDNRSFEVMQQIERGDFDQFISSEAKEDLKTTLEKARTGEIRRQKFTAYNEAVAQNYELAEMFNADQMSIVDVEERLSQTAMELADERLKAAPDSDVVAAKSRQVEILKLLRDAKLEEIGTAIQENDVDTEARLLTISKSLLETSDGKPTKLVGNLDDLLAFQEDATRAFYEGKLTKDTYTKWMKFSQAALYNEAASGFGRGGFLGLGKKQPPVSGKFYKRALRDITKFMDEPNPITGGPADGQWAVEAFRFFVDEIMDISQGDLNNALVNEDTVNRVLQNAKTKAYLRLAGYPIYTRVGDMLPTPAGNFPVKGFDPDTGEPVLDVNEEDLP